MKPLIYVETVTLGVGNVIRRLVAHNQTFRIYGSCIMSDLSVASCVAFTYLVRSMQRRDVPSSASRLTTAAVQSVSVRYKHNIRWVVYPSAVGVSLLQGPCSIRRLHTARPVQVDGSKGRPYARTISSLLTTHAIVWWVLFALMAHANPSWESLLR